MHFFCGGGGAPGGTDNLWGARAPQAPRSYAPAAYLCLNMINFDAVDFSERLLRPYRGTRLIVVHFA